MDAPADSYAACIQNIIFLLNELLTLDKNIPDVINSNDIEELNTLLDKKQGIISEIEKMNQEITENNYSLMNDNPRIKALLNERFRLLNDIYKLEKANIRLATEKHKEYEQMIKRASKEQHIKSYTMSGQQSYFLDEKK